MWALALLATAATTAAGMAMMDSEAFPHEKHARVFPSCAGCHAGAFNGNEAQLYPAPATCETCHDGKDEKRVEWAGPTREPDNLRFDHAEHAREAGREMGPDTAACQRCHTKGGAGPRMAVVEARPAECLSCHEHRATTHLAADSRCSTCHLTLVEARELPDSAIAALPLPPSHREPNFISRHAPQTPEALQQCATCHARESCARCHPNVGALRSAQALGADARVARLAAARGAEYPVPASHRDPEFATEHGAAAKAKEATCENCHAQPSCRSCHIGRSASREIGRLPEPPRGAAPGVMLRGQPREWPVWGTSGATQARPIEEPPAPTAHRPVASAIVSTRRGGPPPAGQGSDSAARMPDRYAAERVALAADTTRRVRGPRDVRVHPVDFERAHGVAAASGQLSCEGCHQKRFCSSCHDGEGSRRFHPANFAARHGSNAWGRERDCASCHDTRSYCRDCHQSSGIASAGRLNVAFHTAQPDWLLAHGRAARQGLESCTSCHTQRDCMQCHSQRGWSVSPHGPGFEAEAMGKRNPEMCLRCHVTDPLRRP